MRLRQLVRTAGSLVDESEIVDAVMALIRSDQKILRGLASGRMKPAEAAKEGRMQYLAEATAKLRADVRQAQAEIERRVREMGR